MEIVLDDTPVGSKSTINYQSLNASIAGAGNDGDCRTHGIANDAQPILRRAFLRIGDSSEKIVDFAITQCHRSTDFYAMPIKLKKQDVVTGFPKMHAHTEEISHT